MIVVDRRVFFQLASVGLISQMAWARLAGASRAEFWIGDDAGPGPGTIQFRNSDNTFGIGKPERQVAPKSIGLVSVTNDNSQFSLRLVFHQLREGRIFLSFNGTWWGSKGLDHEWQSKRNTPEGSECFTNFVVDRKVAMGLADALKISLHERKPLDQDLRATWTVPSAVMTHSAEPIPIRLQIENFGKSSRYVAPVVRRPGIGDYGFSFKIVRDGTPVPLLIEDLGYGVSSGAFAYTELAPGRTVSFSTDLRSWTEWMTPGQYSVDAVYGLRLSGKDPSARRTGGFPTDSDLADFWQASFAWRTDILVR